MTWRAFIIGLIGAAAFALLDPYTSFIKSYGWLTASCFPTSAVLALIVLTVGANVLLKLVRRGLELTQPELMLAWCMLIVGAAIPCEGIGRYWYSLLAGPPYMARRPDLLWTQSGALSNAPAGLVLSTDPKSTAAVQYYEGSGEKGRVPWRVWMRPLAEWGLFLLMMYMAVFFLCGILRRQWVDVDRLMFPLARVPLEFTEEDAGRSAGLLPSVVANKAFLIGVIATAAFRLVRACPLFFGATQGMPLTIPLGDVFQGTPLQSADFLNFEFWPVVVGFAFLVPADVSLSVWFFFLFSRAELYAANRMALPRAWGTWSPLMQWQQAGACVAFGTGIAIMARRHLWTVFRNTALWRKMDDAEEPIRYRFAAWGFLVSIAGCLVWYVYEGMGIVTAAVVLAMLFCSFFVYARIVAQGGLYVSRTEWNLAEVVHGVSGGRAFSGPGAVIGQMQGALLLSGSTNTLAPLAMGAFRISSVFKKRRRLLLPALIAALVVAIVCTTYTTLGQAYRTGALNFSDTWSAKDVPMWAFEQADRMIKLPSQSAEPYLGPAIFGGVLTWIVMFMRARFYWWPIHPIGLISISGWHAHRLWLPFFLGWLTKVSIMKLAGGQTLRDARYFFIALILTETFLGGVSALVSTVTHGSVPGF
jgi:hypothetical protein